MVTAVAGKEDKALPSGKPAVPSGISQAMHAFHLNRDQKPVPLPPVFKNDWAWASEQHFLRKDIPPPKGPLFVSYGDATSCSNRDWRTLRDVTVNDLKCPYVHSDQVFICRIITSPRAGTGATFFVEDARGLAIMVHAPHIAPELGLDLGEDILYDMYPVGAVLAICEPYVKYSANHVGVEICVDIPTDMTRIHTRDPLIRAIKWAAPLPIEAEPTVEQLKTQGNEAFAKREYEYGYERYTLALAAPETERDIATTFTLLLNRAILSIKQGCPGAAYRDCIAAEALGLVLSAGQTQKLTWRKALAAYDLRMWTLAEKHCDDALKFGVQLAAGLQKDIRQRLLETRGIFDWRDLWTRLCKTGSVVMADYIGPIKLERLPGRGRGLVLTEDVKAGQLLLVDQALVRSVIKGRRELFELDCALNVAANTASVSIYSKNKAIHELIDNPGKMKLWTGLTYLDSRTGRPAEIPDPMLRPTHSLEDLFVQVNIEPCRLSAILRSNAFGTEPDVWTPATIALPDGTMEKEGAGGVCYRLGSLFNHSCCANVNQEQWRESAVVRARMDLPKGTELVLTYLQDSYASRKERLARSWRFTCDCELCVADSQDDHAKRTEIMRAFNPYSPQSLQGLLDPRAHETSSLKIINDLEKTYAVGRRIKPEVFEHASLLCLSPDWARKAYLNLGATLSTTESRKIHGRQLDTLGLVNPITFPKMLVAASLFSIPHPEEAASWIATACWAHDVLHGGGRWLFEQKFAALLPKNISWDYKNPVQDHGPAEDLGDDLD